MAIIIIGNERIPVETGITIEKALIGMKKHPDAYIFLLQGKPVPMTAAVERGMEIEAVLVASGG